ncbi:hypothetical protein GCM10009804_40970 [Kribbella hippodromi]|uniref:Uncharacterized protein n=1 Tax=Kribbella hippodromi TaxID=434347 RepID=A0ABP4PN06_9ACTN
MNPPPIPGAQPAPLHAPTVPKPVWGAQHPVQRPQGATYGDTPLARAPFPLTPAPSPLAWRRLRWPGAVSAGLAPFPLALGPFPPAAAALAPLRPGS